MKRKILCQGHYGGKREKVRQPVTGMTGEKGQKKLMGKTETIDVVMFDFGGVLAEEGWKNGFTAIARAQGLDGDWLVEAAADTAYETGYLTGVGSEKKFWRVLKWKTGISGDEAALRQEIFSRFVVRDWMIDYVKRLRGCNLIVGILSDQIDMLDELNAAYDFFKFFDYVFNSYHIGKGKRDASLFDDIAARIKRPAERIVFVDDHPGHVERARQKGWKAVHYRDAGSFFREMDQWTAHCS